MKALRRFLVALMALAVIPLTATTQAGSEVTPLLGRYIVVLHEGVPAAGVADSLGGSLLGLGGTVSGVFGTLDSLLVTLPLGGVAALEADPRVAFVAPDRPIQLYAENTPSGVTRIGAGPRLADDGSVLAGPEPKAAVAILDTGIDLDHPDLNVVGGQDCANDLLGDLLGGGGYGDNHGHGTHVAGTVGARANGAGVVGVSPGAPLYAVKVFGALGAGSLSDVVCGLNWVAANAASLNIKVVNMSLGGAGLDDDDCGVSTRDPFHAAVCKVNDAGVTVVVAAGNEGVDLVTTVPATYKEVLSVAAVADYDGLPGGLGSPTCRTEDGDDTAADFSNWAAGPEADHVIAAPGVCITSTWNDGGYETISGTSMASPHVAGAVARCIDAGPCAGLTPAQIIAKLRADAAGRPADTGFFGDPNQPVETRYYGHLLNAGGF